MENCVFCKIVRGEISCMKVFEDDSTLAFMDTAGDVDGHILVIPKWHCGSVLDCDEDMLFRVFHTVKRISNHLTEECGYNGVNILNANGESAGQSVPHLHVHLIPRKTNDGVDAWPKFPGAKHNIDNIHRNIRI